MKEAILLPEFLAKCDVLEQSFKDILTPGNASIQAQFEDFLIENLDRVRNMTEREFHRFIVKQSVDGPYGDYIKYILL
jgi:hypothetical protein